MRVHLNTEDITRIKSLMEALNYEGNFELEVDNSSGIGSTVIAHVPQSINCLRGTFSHIISNEENW